MHWIHAAAVATAMAAAARADDRPAAPPKTGYMKVRVEVEVRGVMHVADKGVRVTTYTRAYDSADDAKEIPDRTIATDFALDFTRAKDLRELAKALDGK